MRIHVGAGTSASIRAAASPVAELGLSSTLATAVGTPMASATCLVTGAQSTLVFVGRHLGCLHRFLRLAVHNIPPPADRGGHNPRCAVLLKEPILLYKKIIPQTRKFDLPLSTGSYHFYMKGCLKASHQRASHVHITLRVAYLHVHLGGNG